MTKNTNIQNYQEMLHLFDYSLQSYDQLKISLDILKTLLDEAFIAVCILDQKGFVRYLSKRTFEYFGLSPGEGIDAHISEVVEKDDVAQMFLDVIRTGKSETRKISQCLGKEYVSHTVPLKHEGEIIGAVGLVLIDFAGIEELAENIKVLQSQLKYYKTTVMNLLSPKYSFENIIGEDETMKNVVRQAQKASNFDIPVLLLGESGTGKELFAHAIHNQSRRRSEPFIKVNCSAFSIGLIESELFGYEPGSFTGALKSGKKGKFELAHRGSIFLDEIGDMPLQMQSELLRVLENKEVDKVGGSKPIQVDFRLIAATNKDLEDLIGKGMFREDLYYRINVIRLELPPLRKRLNDVSVLTQSFLKHKSEELGLKKIIISPLALKVLMTYDYPGNVRELINILERALSGKEYQEIAKGELLITEEDIALAFGLATHQREKLPGSVISLKAQEYMSLKEAIKITRGNLTKCANFLGLHRNSVHRKIKLLNLEQEVLLSRKKA